MTPIPRELRLLGYPFEVRIKSPEEMPDNMGRCHQEDAYIELRVDQSELSLADTLIHEIFHAILYCQGRENGGRTEELYVRALATGLVGALRDNPQLLAWITETINKKNNK